MTAAARWSDDLAAWAIPDEILAQAPTSPWIHPVAMFTAPDDVVDSPSHARARVALPSGGSVLDVGSGGGRATRALIPPAGEVIGVDEQQAMLDEYAAMAERLGVAHQEFHGKWPAIADDVPMADVVVSHHVAYNVADLVPFLQALDRHARRRVVMEIPIRHPLTDMSSLWKRFWNLDRPERPTAADVVAVAAEAGISAEIEYWEEPPGARPALPGSEQAEFMTIRLCLPSSREPEVAAVLEELGPRGPRQMATISWTPAGR